MITLIIFFPNQVYSNSIKIRLLHTPCYNVPAIEILIPDKDTYWQDSVIFYHSFN